MFSSDNCLLAEKHLRFLYGQAKPSDGLITFYTKTPYAVEFFSVEAFQRAAEFASALSEDRDVYHLVNLLSRDAVDEIRARHGRGMEAELESVVALVCEIDTYTGSHRQSNYPSQEMALEALFGMPLRPSLIILSGPADGGLHVFWILNRPVSVVNSRERKQIKAISKGWQEKLREKLSPHRLDSTFDLVRVLRMPGCRNHKYEDAVTRALVVTDGRYDVDDFARFVKPAGDAGERTQRDELSATEANRLERCRNYLQLIPDAISGQQGHNKTFRAACECFRFGLSESDAEEIMQWFNAEKTPAEDKWSAAELEHKLETAQSTVKEAGQFGMRLER